MKSRLGKNKQQYVAKSFCKKYPNQILVVCVMAVAYIVSQNWYQLLLVRGDSMAPAYHNMQLVLLDKRADEYTYGDVAAFWCEGLNCKLVKRIAACPGDQVVIRDGILYVNHSASQVFPARFTDAGIAGTKIQLGDSQYFVIGDQTAKSKDSRSPLIGCVEDTDFYGKVIPQADPVWPETGNGKKG